jgi:Tubulin-tyrosine ligase family
MCPTFYPLSTLVFFFQVASLDPLIVLYMDGYVRIGNATHDEKASFAHFGEILKQHHGADTELQKRIVDPITHVRNQCKESLSLLVDAFKNKTFQRGTLTSEDAFELYSADYIVDNDLNIWLLVAHEDTDMDGTY